MQETTPVAPAVFTINDLRFMHERAWNRIIWYRTEMWKTSIALYSALAGFVAVSIEFGDKVSDRNAFAIISLIVGIILIALYGTYLNSLAKAAKNCNEILEMREKFLCDQLGLSSKEGFRTNHNFFDTSYSYLASQKPTIEILKIGFACCLLILGVACVYCR